MEQNKILIGLVIGLIIGAGLGYMLAPEDNIDTSEYEDEIVLLQNQIEQVESQKNRLETNLNTAQDEIESSTNALTDLSSDYESLNDDYSELLTSYDELSDNYNELSSLISQFSNGGELVDTTGEGLEINILDSYEDSYGHKIIGTISNTDTLNHDSVEITAIYRDDQGNMLGTEDFLSYRTWGSIIPSQETHYFEISHDVSPDTVSVSSQSSTTNSDPYTSFMISDEYAYTDDSWLHISGLITNIGSQSRSYTTVMAVIFDESNNVIELRETIVTDLNPGDTKPFEIKPNLSWLNGEYDVYLLYVYSTW